MIVRTVRIRYSTKLGLPNYSSAEGEVEITAELEDGETPEAAITEGWRMVKAGVVENIRVAKTHVAEQQAALGEDAYDNRNSRASYR